MLRCRALLCICCLLFCLALGFAKSVGEERLIGWKGEVHRGKGETKQLRGGGVPKRSGAAPKRRRWIEQIATKPRCVSHSHRFRQKSRWCPQNRTNLQSSPSRFLLYRRAYLYHGLLSEEECTHIIKVSRPRLRRSLVRMTRRGARRGNSALRALTYHLTAVAHNSPLAFQPESQSLVSVWRPNITGCRSYHRGRKARRHPYQACHGRLFAK